MKAREKLNELSLLNKNYINEINWDFLFFKSLTVTGSVVFMGLLGYILWYAG